MTVFERLARLHYRFYDRMRHADASRVAGKPGIPTDLESLRSHHYCLLVTFKRSGEPVPTPVLFGPADGKLYFRTESDAKIKRIRKRPARPRGTVRLARQAARPPLRGHSARAGTSMREYRLPFAPG